MKTRIRQKKDSKLLISECNVKSKYPEIKIISYRFLSTDKKEPSIEKVDIDNFLVKTNYDRTVINKTEPTRSDSIANMNAESFMANVEKDANRRAAERKQREMVAQELRK